MHARFYLAALALVITGPAGLSTGFPHSAAAVAPERADTASTQVDVVDQQLSPDDGPIDVTDPQLPPDDGPIDVTDPQLPPDDGPIDVIDPELPQPEPGNGDDVRDR